MVYFKKLAVSSYFLVIGERNLAKRLLVLSLNSSLTAVAKPVEGAVYLHFDF